MVLIFPDKFSSKSHTFWFFFFSCHVYYLSGL
ncbi:unnamed protein product [Thlaspi arvense]|uniref:Uncharacterized protein n=1 Tax=Thlaspi arvense TaxID=13288 RepID=A0AAU9RQA6_THLAR|nr:unnamed protein product [Thlaspi arvense]